MVKTYFKRKFLPIFLLGTIIFGCNTPREKQILAADFDAIPNDGQNDMEALRKAIAACKENPGSTLYLAPGVYDLADDYSIQLMNDAMSGKYGGNPQGKLFQPYFKHTKALDFSGLKDITVEAAGATLLVNGWMEPLSLQNCSGVTVKGLTIDFKRKPYTQAKVVDVQPEWFDCEIDPRFPVDSTMSLLRVRFWDAWADRELPQVWGGPSFQVIKPNTLRVFLKVDPSVKGDFMVTPHSFHFRPAILIQEAENMVLEDVTIHTNPGMGIVGHRANNITMKGLRIVPAAGRVQSTDTDATHFTTCKGLIRFENCQFEGQGDDGTNIHNYYYCIEKSDSVAGYKLEVKNADRHAGVLDYPDVGDTLEMVSVKTLATVKKFAVKTVDNNPDKMYTQVTLNEELPSDLENYYLINATRLPRVEIVGCTFTGNLARSILIKTRNVLIEHCLIREATGTGIHIGAEGSWHEGPTSENVVVRYNRILRCGFGAGTIAGASAIAVDVSAEDNTIPGLHKHILIEGNIIECGNPHCAISVVGAKDVTIRNNEISPCGQPVKVKYTDNIQIYSNMGAEDSSAKEVK